MSKALVSTALIALLLPGCGSSDLAESPPADDGSEILGDWFYCKGPGCAELNDDGVAFRTGGAWFELEADGAVLEPGASWCEKRDAGHSGTFEWDGRTLRLSGTGGTLGCTTDGCTFEVDGDTATLVTEDDRSVQLERVPTNVSGECA